MAALLHERRHFRTKCEFNMRFRSDAHRALDRAKSLRTVMQRERCCLENRAVVGMPHWQRLRTRWTPSRRVPYPMPRRGFRLSGVAAAAHGCLMQIDARQAACLKPAPITIGRNIKRAGRRRPTSLGELLGKREPGLDLRAGAARGHAPRLPHRECARRRPRPSCPPRWSMAPRGRGPT